MNRLLKLLVIFFVATLLTIIIYKKYNNNENNILILSDELSLGISPFNKDGKSYIDYLKKDYNNINYANIYKNFTYKELYRMIYYDEDIYYKGEYKNIKYVIRNSDYIILSLNNKLNSKKCNKTVRITKEYLSSLNEEINKIISLINNIGATKIIVLSPYCINSTNEINNLIDSYKFNSNNVIYININNHFKDKTYYIPNNEIPYPSIEGQILLYNLIKNEIKI